MGYRSDVRIMTTQKGFKELKKFIDNYLKEKNYKYGNSLDECKIIYEDKYAKYIGWNGIKWYRGENYEDIDAIEEGLDHLREKDLSYRFARIGESYDDYEEYSYESENFEDEQDLEFPNMERYFDDEYVVENMKLNAGIAKENIFVNCGGSLQKFNSKEEVMDFYEDCILMSEGSERDRYSNIYFQVKTHLNDDQRCFTDGTEKVYMTKIDPTDVSKEDEKILKKYYDINLNELQRFKVRNELSEHSYIYPSILEKYENIDDLYDNYLTDKSEHSYFYFDEDSIICIDTNTSGTDKYWEEEFPLEDYKYANLWLKGEIEYSDYLETKKDSMEM